MSQVELAINSSKNDIYIFDFDSTITQIEAFDVLSEIVIVEPNKRKKVSAQIEQITIAGIDGTLPFTESLKQRLALLTINKAAIEKLIRILRRKIAPSIRRSKDFFRVHRDHIYVISAGFKEFIVPIVKTIGIDSSRVYANTFIFDKEGIVVGFDKNNPLSKHNGKIDLVKQLNLSGNVHVIGDGYSDYMIKREGLANRFYAFVENTERETSIDVADHVTPSLEEFLYINKLPMNISYPKNRIKAIVDKHTPSSLQNHLKKEGYSVEIKTLSESVQRDLKDVGIIVFGRNTKIFSDYLFTKKSLHCVATFSNDLEYLNLKKFSESGIAVFKANYIGARPAAELVIAESILLMRNIQNKNQELHQGIWNNSMPNSHEIRGKTMGIVGYGQVGMQVSILAEQMGMSVVFYDKEEKMPLGNARKMSKVEHLYKKSDIVSFHIPNSEENFSFVREKHLKMMKEHVVILNLSGQKIVEKKALLEVLKSKKIKGYGVDIAKNGHSKNTPFDSELRGLPNVFMTPFVSGFSKESIELVSNFLSKKIIEYINTGNSSLNISLPQVSLPVLTKAHRLLFIHKNVSGILSAVYALLAKHNVNVLGQYLNTNATNGYLILDVNKKYDPKIVDQLKKMKATIKLRVLY